MVIALTPKTKQNNFKQLHNLSRPHITTADVPNIDYIRGGKPAARGSHGGPFDCLNVAYARTLTYTNKNVNLS